MRTLLNRKFALALLATLASAGCKGPPSEAAAKAELPAVSVRAEAATLMEVPRTLRLTGTLRGDREADLAANASGRVLSTSVERGEQVKPGQVLARLDTRALALSATEARAQVDSARAQEEQARLECDRYEQLKAKGAITDLEYQQKITQCRTLPLSVQAATARAALAAQNVGDGLIRAPFAGVITERFVEVGQFLRQDSRVVTIVSTDPLRLQLAVPEAQVQSVKEGASVTFGVSAFPGKRFEGTVRFVSGALRATTRDLIAEAMVPNPSRALLPGMFADVELTIGSERLPSVPKSALLMRDDQARVFALVAGRLEERIVALGPERGDRVAVSHGVRDTEQVVVSELTGLSNGQRVR
jgi:membrane fusion protein, multidrug efflux system